MPSNMHKPAMAVVQANLQRFSVWQGERLDNQFFGLTLAVAFIFHVAALYAWWLAPKTQVIDIPVRALNVKLGSEEMPSADEIKAVQENDNSRAVESTLSRLVRVEEKSPDKIKPVPKKIDKVESKKTQAPPKPVAPTTPKQYVREQQVAPAVKAALGEGKDSGGNKELMSRYEQLISMWIQKFKQYPDEARRQSMQGETMVRIRIDRRGNIHYWALENSTGYSVLDKAAIEMVKRANPVPAVPMDYPAGEQFDFLIPVNFRLE